MTLGPRAGPALRQDPGRRPVRDGPGGARRLPIAADRAAGRRPIAIVATIGTTSSTSVDPVAAVADIARPRGPVAPRGRGLRRRRGAHARTGAAPFAGWERADSIVVNPHKWLFTPLDASLLLSRRMDWLRAAFSLVPEYLRTLDRRQPRARLQRVPAAARPADAGAQAVDAAPLVRDRRACGARIATTSAGRRVRGLGRRGPDWERLAPAPFSTVCFRYRPRRLAGREDEPEVARGARRTNTPRHGRRQPSRRGVPLAHPPRDRFTIRIAIGNLRTEPRHVERAWTLAAPRGRASSTSKEHQVTEPVEILYFYRTRWGSHDEFLDALPRATTGRSCASSGPPGRYHERPAVHAPVPRRGRGGLGRAGLDHIPRLGGDRRSTATPSSCRGSTRTRRRSRPRSAGASSCSRRTGTWCSRPGRSTGSARPGHRRPPAGRDRPFVGGTNGVWRVPGPFR